VSKDCLRDIEEFPDPMKLTKRILIATAVGILLLALVAPAARRNGFVGIAIEMDRNSGDRRQVVYPFCIPLRSEPSLWISAYATPHPRAWQTVHMNTGIHGVRITWAWGIVHAALRQFGDALEAMDVGEDVKRAAASELLRLIRTTDRVVMIQEVIIGVQGEMWGRLDAGEVMDAEQLRVVFATVEEKTRDDWDAASRSTNQPDLAP
jgi:hypothetical protein